jgi:hypothetical protein
MDLRGGCQPAGATTTNARRTARRSYNSEGTFSKQSGRSDNLEARLEMAGEAMAKGGALREAIRELYAVTGRLEAMYPERKFTPDGHMVGSLGEVVAAEMHSLELFEASHPVHDAVAPDGRLVQVKATQGSRVALTDEPDYLIVLKLRRDGTFDEVYNGPGGPAWAAAGKMQKTGQRHISLSRLAELDASVPEGGRIP